MSGLTPANSKMGEREWSRAKPNEAWLPKHANLTGIYKEEEAAVITQKETGHSRISVLVLLHWLHFPALEVSA